MNPTVNATELCQLLGIGVVTLWRHVKQGRLPSPTRSGPHSLYDVREVVAAIRRNNLRVDPKTLELIEAALTPQETHP